MRRNCSLSEAVPVVALAGLFATLPGCGLFPPPPAPAGPFTQIVIFGDSLSDAGNIHAAFSIVPQAPYFDGRISNGPVWVERLAAHFGLAARPSFRGGTNFAFGASNTGRGLGFSFGLPLGPNVRQQVDLYRGQPVGTELFVVWGGANDIFNTLRDECSDPPATIADNVYLAVARLYELGGRWFLVPNLPDIGQTPRYREGERHGQATQLSSDVNEALAARLDQLETLPGIRIWRMDVAAMFAELIASPPPGVTNTTDPAWTGGFLGYAGGEGELVENPDAHLFWDEVHPSRVSHQLLADAAIALLESSPPAAAPSPGPAAFALNILPPETEFWLLYFSLIGHPEEGDACRY